MRAIYRKVILLLLIICVLSLGLTAVLGNARLPHDQSHLSVVAAIYPMYTAALNVVGDCEGVDVTCLTAPTAGCLHDYQLSPSERATLSSADVLVLNGAGAESFLTDAMVGLRAVVVDTSHGVSALSGHDEHEGHHHEANEHTWVDPLRYAAQVRALCDGLCAADPHHAATYRANTDSYLAKIETVQQELDAVSLSFSYAMLFHTSMAYVAESLHLETVGILNIGEDEAASAADLTALAESLHGKNVLFLYDDQYDALYEVLTSYAARAAVVRWQIGAAAKPNVADRDAWLCAMWANITALKEVTV